VSIRFTGLRRALSSERADAVTALALAVPALVQVLVAPIAARGVGVVVALGSTVPIAWRRTRPAAAAAAGATVWLIPTTGFVYLGYVSAFLLFYSLAAHVAETRVVVAVVAYGVGVSIMASAIDGVVLGEYFGAVTTVVAPALVGRVVRHQREQARALEELTLHLEHERERGERAAVAEERTRIARELHDVVAHGLSVIAIQSEAAEAALALDPKLAEEPLRTIRGSTIEALAEMRRMLGVLREDGDGEELAPQPGMAELPALIERAEAAGVPITLDVLGVPATLRPSLDLSAYRIVQEALTNVRKHAPGAPATVRVAWSPERVTVEVSNPGSPRPPAPGSDGGHGLIGIRERVRLHGGELRVGAGADGGFVVAATFPLGVVA
jgi:signal transduction histidine kinase